MGNNNCTTKCIDTSKALEIQRQIVNMYANMGSIAELVNDCTDRTLLPSLVEPHLRHIIQCILRVAHSLSINMSVVVRNKLAVNNEKYPVQLCRSTAGKPGIDKYWKHCWYTGITKDTRSIVLGNDSHFVVPQTFSVYEQRFKDDATSCET